MVVVADCAAPCVSRFHGTPSLSAIMKVNTMHARQLVRNPMLFMTIACVASSALAAGTRPNIVFIFTDDQRFDAIGAVDEAVTTPNLDRLAARGTRFANAFVTLSICSPSRAAVMTGQYGHVNGVTTLGRRIAEHDRTIRRTRTAAEQTSP
jgi:hypothetical protein